MPSTQSIPTFFAPYQQVFLIVFLIDCRSWTGLITIIPLLTHSFGSLWLFHVTIIYYDWLWWTSPIHNISLKPLHTLHDYAVPEMWASLVTTNWGHSIFWKGENLISSSPLKALIILKILLTLTKRALSDIVTLYRLRYTSHTQHLLYSAIRSNAILTLSWQ